MAAVVQRERLSGALSLSRLESTPSPGPRELLLRVHYSALNRMDLLQAKGRYVLPPGTSPILGVEVSE
jgi:NADPH:quinone reductase-like Zn-dependent oxidoreductase